MSFDFDVTVIGGGCVGSSIIYALSRQGLRNCALLDSGLASRSATAASGGMIRAFHEDPRHVELAVASLKLLQGYGRDGVLTEDHAPNGSLYFFDRRRFDAYEASLKVMEAAGYPYEVITAPQGSRRFPEFHWEPEAWAVYEPRGTHRTPLRFVEDLQASAADHGATLLNPFEVLRISRYGDRYRLAGAAATVTTRHLVLAGGASLLPRLSDLALDLPLTGRTLRTVHAPKLDAALQMPSYFDRESLEFGRFGAGAEVVLASGAPPRVARKIWADELVVREARDCDAPGRIGLMGEVPGFRRLSVATGWGGTGFKFALEIGQRVAQGIARSA